MPADPGAGVPLPRVQPPMRAVRPDDTNYPRGGDILPASHPIRLLPGRLLRIRP